MKLGEYLSRFIFTRRCPACSELLDFDVWDEAFCRECREKWEIEKAKGCNICGKAICECECMTKTLSASGALCHRKIVKYSISSPTVHNTLIFIKKNNNPRVSGFLASQLALIIEADPNISELVRGDAIVTYVPRSRSAIVKYGHDQSEIIAKLFADRLGISCITLLRRKKRRAVAQKKLGAKERAKNVKNMFEVIPGNGSFIEGKTVLLFDDIVTTGSSMGACVSHLVRAGARFVVCLSVATTENSKSR